MEPKIIIVGSPSDEKAVLDAEISLSMKGFNAESKIISADRDSITDTDADYTLLWLSKNASHDLFAIAKGLNNRMKKCINIFSESMSVSKQQKEVIGGNHSIFVELNPEGWIDDLSQLTCKVAPQDEGAKITPTSPTVEGASESNNDPDESQPTIEDIEEEQTVSKRVLWMPCLWYVISILYYACIKIGIIKAWTDQFWYLVVTVGFFYFAYKIIRSTISAIKLNKWCYAYIPFSIYMVLYDLLYGFNLLSAYL